MSDHELLEQYRQYLITVKNASSNTENSYMRDLRQLQSYLFGELKISLTDADEPSLRNYLDYLRDSGKSASTLSRNIASWKNFYQFLLQRSFIEENPAAHMNSEKSEQKLLNKELNKFCTALVTQVYMSKAYIME